MPSPDLNSTVYVTRPLRHELTATSVLHPLSLLCTTLIYSSTLNKKKPRAHPTNSTYNNAPISKGLRASIVAGNGSWLVA